MPIYEYFCAKCKTEFELMRPFSEADKPGVCPKCNSQAQKLVSGFGSKTGSYIQAPAEAYRGGLAESPVKVKVDGKKVKKSGKQRKSKGETGKKA